MTVQAQPGGILVTHVPAFHAPPTIGYLQILAGAALFGFNAGVSKVVLDAGLDPVRLIALRLDRIDRMWTDMRPLSLRVAHRTEVPN
jgi:hypothetical protein